MPKVIALELENFQTIAKRTVIPIRPLTLTFGPNGAGKSALFDAIELIKLIVSDDWGVENANLIDALERHSRNSTTKTPTNSLGIGIQLEMESDWTHYDLDGRRLTFNRYVSLNDFAEDGEHAAAFPGRTLRVFIKFFRDQQAKGWSIFELDFTIDSERVLCARAKQGEYPLVSIFNTGWIHLFELETHSLKLKPGVEFSDNAFHAHLEFAPEWDSSPNRWFTGGLGSVLVDYYFCPIVQDVIDLYCEIIREAIDETSVVRASRQVPSISQSIALVDGMSFQTLSGKSNPGLRLDWSPLLQVILPKVNQADELWVRICAAATEDIGVKLPESPAYFDDLGFIQRLNYFLREDLFIDNGYQVVAEILCLAEPDEYDDLPTLRARGYPKLVRLFLMDGHGRHLEFEDVGSGIGYVIPVLAALSQDGISLIQQPELHLHPALQSKLGDVVVRAVESKSFFKSFTLIETHSEHLLLRVMRLIRNSSGREPEVLVPLKNEDVAILYFEPLASSETRVKRLRLSSDGELIDRWPGGFFNERYRDIFDE